MGSVHPFILHLKVTNVELIFPSFRHSCYHKHALCGSIMTNNLLPFFSLSEELENDWRGGGQGYSAKRDKKKSERFLFILKGFDQRVYLRPGNASRKTDGITRMT